MSSPNAQKHASAINHRRTMLKVANAIVEMIPVVMLLLLLAVVVVVVMDVMEVIVVVEM